MGSTGHCCCQIVAKLIIESIFRVDALFLKAVGRFSFVNLLHCSVCLAYSLGQTPPFSPVDKGRQGGLVLKMNRDRWQRRKAWHLLIDGVDGAFFRWTGDDASFRKGAVVLSIGQQGMAMQQKCAGGVQDGAPMAIAPQ